MTIKYTGPCEELYGQEIDVPDHDCRAHLKYQTCHNVETHGLDCGPYEEWDDEWWECAECGAKFAEEEANNE